MALFHLESSLISRNRLLGPYLLLEPIVQAGVTQPWVLERCSGTHPPALALHQKPCDEVLGLLRHIQELLLLEVPLAR